MRIVPVLDVQGDAFIFKVGIVAFGFYAKAEIALAVIAKVVRLVVVDAVAVFIHDIVLVDDVHKVRKVVGWEGDKVIADGFFLTRVVYIAFKKQRFAVYRIFLRDVYIAVTGENGILTHTQHKSDHLRVLFFAQKASLARECEVIGDDGVDLLRPLRVRLVVAAKINLFARCVACFKGAWLIFGRKPCGDAVLAVIVRKAVFVDDGLQALKQ